MKRNKVGKIILFIGICLFMTSLGYVVTKYLDKNLYLNTNLLVTFEDYKEFNLENTDVLTKDEAILEYPNKFIIENRSLKNVNYSIKLIEIDSNIENDKLNYILYKNDKEIKSGLLSEIDDILYQTDISIKKKDYYKLYIYLNEKEEEPKYTYKLEVTSK